MAADFQKLYDESYFMGYRSDAKRREMYRHELGRLRPWLKQQTGAVLDIGCGLGDFLALGFSDWQKFGIEVSNHARQTAEHKDIRFYFPDHANQFDVIILRGSIQHLHQPLKMLWDAHAWLKPGGLIVFLATPNARSLPYRMFGDMPMLEPARNFVVFSDKMLCTCLKHIGFQILQVHKPYADTPYANPWRDYWRFALRCLGIKRPFAWPGNMMEIIARKV